MLQQILTDMFIDPDLLAELDEEQKHTLFCKMRTEQVRRWKNREEQLEKEEAKRPKIRKRKVQFLLGNDGKPWTWVMGEHSADKTMEEIIEAETRQSAIRLAEKEMENIRQQMESMPNVENTNVEKPAAVFTVRNIRSELRGPRPAVPPKGENLLELHRKTKEDRAKEIYAKIKETQRNAEQLSEIIQKEQEELWRERERKAKEAEQKIREIARLAREEHNKVIKEGNNQTETQKTANVNAGLKNSIRHKRSTAFAFTNKNKKRPNKPCDRQAILEWYRNHEFAVNGSGVDSESKKPMSWFHGLISRTDAEALLNMAEPSTFLVRLSERIWGYAISFRAVDRCKHFLIDASGPSYQFFGSGHLSHNSLEELVNHHKTRPITSSGQEYLLHPCPHNQQISNFNELFQM